MPSTLITTDQLSNEKGKLYLESVLSRIRAAVCVETVELHIYHCLAFDYRNLEAIIKAIKIENAKKREKNAYGILYVSINLTPVNSIFGSFDSDRRSQPVPMHFSRPKLVILILKLAFIG